MTRKMEPREILCVDCGNYFIGKYAYICPECRKKRVSEKIKKRAAEFGKMQQDFAESERKSISKLAELIAKRKAAEKLIKAEVCPNYDKTSVSCVTCPAGAFKFKACGVGK